jgi:hypothetical protein
MSTIALLVRQVPAPGLQVSTDGYIRLTADVLRSHTLVHLLSGLDEERDGSFERAQAAYRTDYAGFTEWATETLPSLSLGWDWTLTVVAPWSYRRVGEPRGNVQLIDRHGRDFGYLENLKALAVVVDGLDWQRVVERSLLRRYR